MQQSQKIGEPSDVCTEASFRIPMISLALFKMFTTELHCRIVLILSSFACHGFVQINFARQSQEPKTIPRTSQLWLLVSRVHSWKIEANGRLLDSLLECLLCFNTVCCCGANCHCVSRGAVSLHPGIVFKCRNRPNHFASVEVNAKQLSVPSLHNSPRVNHKWATWAVFLCVEADPAALRLLRVMVSSFQHQAHATAQCG